jgi:CRP-like cAMP-binding protein
MLATFQTIDQRPRLPSSRAADGPPAKPIEPHVLDPLEPRAIVVRAGRDEEIVAQGEAAEYCYLVVSGCVRTVRLMEDGRRQVGEFLFPGDLFGWEALAEHDFGAEAVTPVTLRRYSKRGINELADRDRNFARSLLDLTAGQLRARRQHMVLLGRKTASERIASFLLEMTERVNFDGPALIALPMGRADMADYLGLTIETVCRGLTQLRTRGTIAVERAKIAVRDLRALKLAGCEAVH